MAANHRAYTMLMDKDDPRREPTDEELDELNEHWREPGDPDGVVAAEERERWREIHPAAAVPPPAARKKRRWPVVLLVIVLLAAATFGAYWFGGHQASAPGPKPAKSAETATQKHPAKKPVVTSPKQYSSTNHNMGFSYPADWKLTDTVGKLTVASPEVQMTMPDGKKMEGHALVTVQHKQTAIAGYPENGAVAVLESQKLAYTQPTTIQRAQTYITYLSYEQANGLDAAYVTGDYGVVQHQLVPMADVAADDPLISVTFATCSSADCASGTVTPMAILASSWQSASFAKQATDLIESIQLY